jgi:hypothetical protein
LRGGAASTEDVPGDMARTSRTRQNSTRKQTSPHEQPDHVIEAHREWPSTGGSAFWRHK